MRLVRHLSGAVVAATLCSTPAHARAVVRLAHPNHDTDATANGRAGIKAYLERLGRTLAPGLVLDVTVLNIDMAGRKDEFRPLFRVMGGASWPAITLNYTLLRRRWVVASGEEQIARTLYRHDMAARSSPDPLRYEKAPLRDWFDARFGAYRRAAGR